jgi:hypothetical protein
LESCVRLLDAAAAAAGVAASSAPLFFFLSLLLLVSSFFSFRQSSQRKKKGGNDRICGSLRLASGHPVPTMTKWFSQSPIVRASITVIKLSFPRFLVEWSISTVVQIRRTRTSCIFVRHSACTYCTSCVPRRPACTTYKRGPSH